MAGAISIAASASDSDGSIAKVDFYRNGQLISTATSAPYGVIWSNVPKGVYTLTATQTDASVLRRELGRVAPLLWDNLGHLAARWTALALARLERSELPRGPKTFNDPIWGTIELSPPEVLLLDSPLLQRLRGVRQLGMVHQVYHSAGHDRLEREIG